MSTCKDQYIFKKGEMISNEGDEITSVIYIHKGLIKLHKFVSEGHSQIISIARPNDFVGLLSVFSNNTNIYSITAIEDSWVCFIDKKCMKEEILSNGSFAMDIINRMSKITDEVLLAKLSINTRNLRGRIAYILLDFAEKIYNNNVFDLPVSRKEIAELIDMRIENVIRTMSEFRKDKLIKINGPSIEILDPEMLHKISNAG